MFLREKGCFCAKEGVFEQKGVFLRKRGCFCVKRGVFAQKRVFLLNMIAVSRCSTWNNRTGSLIFPMFYVEQWNTECST